MSAVGGGNVSISDSLFLDNTASVSGGAVHLAQDEGGDRGPWALLERAELRGNRVTGLTAQGGAIAVFESALSLVNCTLANNTAGGGMATSVPPLNSRDLLQASGAAVVIGAASGDNAAEVRPPPTPLSKYLCFDSVVAGIYPIS